jgi:hypothetical protein
MAQMKQVARHRMMLYLFILYSFGFITWCCVAQYRQAITPMSETSRFLLFLPSGGFHNQFITLGRALLLAHHLNRTLLIPPLSPSPHEQNLSQSMKPYLTTMSAPTPESWHRYFNMSRLSEIVPRHEFLSESEWTWRRQVDCYAFGKYASQLSPAAKYLSAHYGIHVNLIPIPNSQNWTFLSWDYVMNNFGNSKDDFICMANLFHVRLTKELRNRDWEDYGAKMTFSETVMDEYVTPFLHELPANFTGIHLRRGDKCKARRGSPCRFTTEKVHDLLQQDTDGNKSVFVATDETRQEEWEKIQYFKWKYINFSSTDTFKQGSPVRKLGWFAPVVIDSAILTYAQQFIGTASSTMSKIIKARRESWLNDIQSFYLEDLFPSIYEPLY